MKISVINGPNINMLGIREPDLYGKADYAALVGSIERAAAGLGVEVTFFQSNSEGDIVTEIQRAYGTADGIVINAAAYTHTSVGSFVSLYAEKVICGKGFAGYSEALAYLAKMYGK